VLGISWRLAEAKGGEVAQGVDAIVSSRLTRDQRAGSVAPDIDVRQLTLLARVIAHGIVAQVCNNATQTDASRFDVHQVCESACAQFRRWASAG
jgi:hypothetical protein